MRSFLRNYKISIPTIGAVLLGVAWLAFGYFGIHTAFIDERVDEDGPVFDAVPAAEVDAVASDDAAEPVSTEPADAAPADADPGSDTGSDTESATGTGADEAPASGAADTDDAADGEAPADGEPPTDAAPEVVTEFTGTFVSEDHPTSGSAVVLGNGTGQRFVRFEDFATDNGPDLNVYLFDDETGEYVDLGDLKGNIGDQNYEIPADVDLTRFDRVSIWCVRFGVGFGSATLMPAA